MAKLTFYIGMKWVNRNPKWPIGEIWTQHNLIITPVKLMEESVPVIAVESTLYRGVYAQDMIPYQVPDFCNQQRKQLFALQVLTDMGELIELGPRIEFTMDGDEYWRWKKVRDKHG